MMTREYRVIVIGGGHAGVEAAWAAANLLGLPHSVALVTADPSKIGVMSCNPAIGGLAKGQIVREIDAMGGLMGLATDATGIQFKVLNTSKGAAVHGPRAQCDKHAYAEEVQRLLATRAEIDVIAGSVERLTVDAGRVTGVVVENAQCKVQSADAEADSGFALCTLHFALSAPSIVLTTGTFMRGLMHTGERKTEGGRHGEHAAVGISASLRELGFELGRLKTGTPPRLRRGSIRWDDLERADGDAAPTPFSDLSPRYEPSARAEDAADHPTLARAARASRFPVLPQVDCRVTTTNGAVHRLIRDNLHRAPMYSGQIESAGPRYCPSIEDKVVRFADRDSHHVYLEPESLRDDWIYCNGISTSLPADVQDVLVRAMPGCEHAEILRYGYAVEYDMVRPHQIHATGMTKLVDGLFLAGQINGTSGYEEAAGQGLVAGLNAARRALGQEPIALGREQAYIGVMLDDLVTKTPVEPYRMFTSRAEHRLLLRADNSADRLTPLASELGLLRHTELGRERAARFAERSLAIGALNRLIDESRVGGVPLGELVRRPTYSAAQLGADVRELAPGGRTHEGRTVSPGALAAVVFSVHTDRLYEPFVERQRIEIRRTAELERRTIPATFDFGTIAAMRTEARQALARFRPSTLGQAGRLEGITPADVTLLAVMLKRYSRATPENAPAR